MSWTALEELQRRCDKQCQIIGDLSCHREFQADIIEGQRKELYELRARLEEVCSEGHCHEQPVAELERESSRWFERYCDMKRMYESVLACNVELNARLYGGGD